MNIVLISMSNYALGYLKESFQETQFNKLTLITEKISNDLGKFLKDHKIKSIETDKLTLKDIANLDLKNSIVLSAASPWIFSKELIEKFGNNFFNVHQSPLPSMRGSVDSYVILYDIRAFQTCLHRVETGIDTGNIVYRKKLTTQYSYLEFYLHFLKIKIFKFSLNFFIPFHPTTTLLSNLILYTKKI